MWRRASTCPPSPLFTSLFNFLCPDPLSEGQSSSLGCPPFLIIHAFTQTECGTSAQHRTLAGIAKAGKVDSLHQSLSDLLQPSVLAAHRNLSPRGISGLTLPWMRAALTGHNDDSKCDTPSVLVCCLELISFTLFQCF